MNDHLIFPSDRYEVKEYNAGGRSILVRAYTGLDYCERPKDAIQKLNLFVPEAYFHRGTIGNYNAGNAPIFMPNTVGGYMPGPADEPGEDRRTGEPNSIFRALEHGYVVASAGVRGRTTGKGSSEFFEGSLAGKPETGTGKKTGRAPAFIVDYKAAIRYLRLNRDLILGDTEKIITNGTSAGGALSALAGASGNNEEYEPYLREIGAADERDDVFAASCYCPIVDLEHADMAYEWLFSGQDRYYWPRFERTPEGIKRISGEGELTEEQKQISPLLKKQFSEYINSLGLRDMGGHDLLTLDGNGEGPFFELVKQFVISSVEDELIARRNGRPVIGRPVPGSEIDKQDYITVSEDLFVDLDWQRFVEKITRMKTVPAFDALDLSSGENEEFGDEDTDARHFTAFSMEHSHVPGAEIADDRIIKLMNPVRQILSGESDVAEHWRVRHGTFDRDTSLAVPVLLWAALFNRGIDADLRLPWGLPHSGDYDLDELFEWIDFQVLNRDEIPGK